MERSHGQLETKVLELLERRAGATASAAIEPGATITPVLEEFSIWNATDAFCGCGGCGCGCGCT